MVIIMNNKKTNNIIWIISIILFVFLLGGGLLLFNNIFSSEDSSYKADRTSSDTSKNNSVNDQNSSSTDVQQGTENSTQEPLNTTPHAPVEEQIATFSTKIYTQDQARQNNISITCNSLNNTIVEKGQTFSFCNTVGPATTSKGYQKADIFDNKGKKKKGLGGGNCQVSTTLYNAVLSVPNLNVTERHAHSNKVPYIQTGKDAAVAYGSYDLKFINNTENNIKIVAQASSSNITVSIISLRGRRFLTKLSHWGRSFINTPSLVTLLVLFLIQVSYI